MITKAEGVDEEASKEIQEKDLIDLNIKLGPRKKILKAFKKLKPEEDLLDFNLFETSIVSIPETASTITGGSYDIVIFYIR